MSAIFKCLRLLIHKAATAMLFFSPILPGFLQPMLPQIGCWLGWNKDSIADAGWQMLGVVMVFSERKDPRQTLFCRKTHSIVAIYFLKGFRGAFNKSHPALESFQQMSACLLESFQRACFWRKTTNFYAIVKSYGFRREKKNKYALYKRAEGLCCARRNPVNPCQAAQTCIFSHRNCSLRAADWNIAVLPHQ